MQRYSEAAGTEGSVIEATDGEYILYADHVEAMKRIAGDSAQQTDPVGYADKRALHNFDKGLSDELSVYRNTANCETAVAVYTAPSASDTMVYYGGSKEPMPIAFEHASPAALTGIPCKAFEAAFPAAADCRNKDGYHGIMAVRMEGFAAGVEAAARALTDERISAIYYKTVQAQRKPDAGPFHIAFARALLAASPSAPSTSAQQAEPKKDFLNGWREAIQQLPISREDAAPAPSASPAALRCANCHGEGVDGEPGDEPGTGYTWKCEECNGTGRVQYRTVPVNPTTAMVDAAYNEPDKLPAAAKKSMAECIRRAILAAPLLPASPAALTDVDAVMAKIQEFASTWAVVGGRFDDGTAMDRAEECKAEIRAILAASPADQVGWQPIVTAPKNQEIWAFNGEQARMQWSEGYADNGEGWALWVWTDALLSDADPEPEQPTHWMPLPADPV